MSSVKRSNRAATRTRKVKKARVDEVEPVLALGTKASKGAKKVSAPVQKDEDELALEEAVFGTSRGTRTSVWDLAEEDIHRGDIDDEFEEDQETGLERLRDENLFFMDDGPTASTSAAGAEDSFVSAFSNSDTDDDDDSHNVANVAPTPKPKAKSTNLRQAAWFDPADEQLSVSLKDVSRLRKLRTTADEDVVSGLDYESRLRKQFEKMHPVPKWAIEARRKVLKRRALEAKGESLVVDSDDEVASGSDDDVDDLLRSAKIRRKVGRRSAIPSGEIEIDRVRDANQAEASSSGVVSIGFHPRAQVLFSATADRRLRLFQIDGTENPLIQALHVPELPITTAAYHPSGSSILMTGNRPFFMSYDLQSGQVLRSPRGLLTGGLGGSDRASTGGQGGMERFKFSQDGEMLAVGGRRGYVHLVDWGAGGVGNGGQVCGEVKMNVAVKGIAWQKQGRELLTLGEDSEVYVWDVGTRKCITRWKDEGGFGACGLETDEQGRYSAVASTTGIVNLYDSSSPLPEAGLERKAVKAIGNLTTSVTSMRFNHDSQILALASRTNKDQMKLVHLPSATVFSNWPTQQTPLHHVTAIDFSRRSEWLAVGNQRGKVLLYTLKSFAAGAK